MNSTDVNPGVLSPIAAEKAAEEQLIEAGRVYRWEGRRRATAHGKNFQGLQQN